MILFSDIDTVHMLESIILAIDKIYQDFLSRFETQEVLDSDAKELLKDVKETVSIDNAIRRYS